MRPACKRVLICACAILPPSPLLPPSLLPLIPTCLPEPLHEEDAKSQRSIEGFTLAGPDGGFVLQEEHAHGFKLHSSHPPAQTSRTHSFPEIRRDGRRRPADCNRKSHTAHDRQEMSGLTGAEMHFLAKFNLNGSERDGAGAANGYGSCAAASGDGRDLGHNPQEAAAHLGPRHHDEAGRRADEGEGGGGGGGGGGGDGVESHTHERSSAGLRLPPMADARGHAMRDELGESIARVEKLLAQEALQVSTLRRALSRSLFPCPCSYLACLLAS